MYREGCKRQTLETCESLWHFACGSRVLPRAFVRLEPCAGKLARTVLRGLGGGDTSRLPDIVGRVGPKEKK